MRHYHVCPIRTAVALALLGSFVRLNAADPLETHWNQVCRVANGRELLLTTTAGDTLEGYCLTMNVNEIAVTTRDKKIVKIARSALSRIEMHRANGHQFSSLMNGVRQGLRYGTESLLSPSAPLGVLVLPSVVAWGAAATPFCLLGDLVYKVEGKQEIKLN